MAMMLAPWSHLWSTACSRAPVGSQSCSQKQGCSGLSWSGLAVEVPQRQTAVSFGCVESFSRSFGILEWLFVQDLVLTNVPARRQSRFGVSTRFPSVDSTHKKQDSVHPLGIEQIMWHLPHHLEGIGHHVEQAAVILSDATRPLLSMTRQKLEHHSLVGGLNDCCCS